jgi:uncharacterized protein (TIGR00159 family)
MELLFSFLGTLRWQDYVDILLISYILFRFYVLFRGTHVLRVLTGIAILWVFQRIAVFFGLILTSWVLQGITAVAALIIIIIFRNEIRSVLQAKNFKTILWGLPHASEDTPIEVIVESVEALSKHRYGALIVLPKNEDLHDFAQKGIPWRGILSKEMITSIFWHDNPVHDGAAVIEGDRVTEVGVILYGTRHRAALGLAETTDALAIFVSEETGNVGVAKDAGITEIADNDQLKLHISEHLGRYAKESGQLRKEKLEFGLAALFSVILVSAVWFGFIRGMDTLIAMEIPLEYNKRDPNMEIIETSVNDVRLQLGGSRALIKSIRPEQIQVRLDLDNAVAGKNAFSITQENITLPPGITLRKITPSVVEATLEITIKKVLPIQADWVGELPKNIIMSEVALVPETITITGGNRILDNISTIYTEKIPLDNIKNSGGITVSPVLNPASLKITSKSRDKIIVYYVITTRIP